MHHVMDFTFLAFNIPWKTILDKFWLGVRLCTQAIYYLLNAVSGKVPLHNFHGNKACGI